MHTELIARFYTAFQQRDWQTMNTCYHANASFSDPVFHNLNAKEVQAMWHMLCLNARNFSLTFADVKAGEQTGHCQWTATYTFSKTGRTVVNNINAAFTFKDGFILTHTDTFDLWKWSRQALGLRGLLLGWAPFFQNTVHRNARKSLARFILEHPEYQ
ncbi:MAG: nuclear transport factor 2 family protein [Bacteroidetes bacterium CHB5]|nr:nuclear transport factor 2 family protein [Bacteroidetes bacterium CHB5]